MEWGSKAEWLETLRKAGLEPEALRQRPRLARAADWFYTSFLILNQGRQCGMSANPVSLSEIESFLRIQRITDPDKAMLFVRVMRQMDSVVLNHSQKKSTA